MIINNPTKPHKCTFDSCNWSFSSRYKLERHTKTHTKVKDFNCIECEKAFANSYGLIAHEKTHKRSANEKPACKPKQLSGILKCPRKRCMKVFSSSPELEEHLQNHDLQHVCVYDGCSKRFAKPSVLKKHLMMHTENRTFKCTHHGCESKGFVTMQKLKRHQQIHENKKEFICAVNGCGKAFNCKEYLDAHKRVHQDTKPLKCPKENCGKHFACNSTLKLHLQLHENFRPFKCPHDYCGKTYLTACSLRTHEKCHQTCPLGASSQEIGEDNVDVNELINLPNMDTAIMSGLVAAFGEFACNQYMNCDVSGPSSEILIDETKSDSGLNAFNELDKERLKDLQEEFVRNIYASSVNIDHSFLPGYSVPPESSSNNDVRNAISSSSFSICDDDELRFGNSETILLEPSMELSTGHMEIDGGHFEASSCMPDHLYSHKIYDHSSTVNLQDIH